MTTGTGLALLGMWGCLAAMWFSKTVRGWPCMLGTIAAFATTWKFLA